MITHPQYKSPIFKVISIGNLTNRMLDYCKVGDEVMFTHLFRDPGSPVLQVKNLTKGLTIYLEYYEVPEFFSKNEIELDYVHKLCVSGE